MEIAHDPKYIRWLQPGQLHDLNERIRAIIRYRVVISFRMPREAHDAYYVPLEARVAELAGCADSDVRKVLDGIRTEIDVVRRFPDEAGYTFIVIRRADGRTGAEGANERPPA